MIYIIGNARSGTSWLGKIFDSHPGVVYRHEPDASHPSYDFPFFIEDDEYEKYRAIASDYLQQLCLVRTSRAVGRRPQFHKEFSGLAGRILRSSTLWLLLLAGRIPIVGNATNKLNVPDFIGPGHKPKYVIKSVISLGRAGLYARALTNGRVVFMMRHPCGVVASQLRGVRLGKLEQSKPLNTISKSRLGRQYGLTLAGLESLTEEEQLAWIWVIMNEQALTGLRDQSNATVITHEALCSNPVQEIKRLFEFCRLPWNSQTEEFLSPIQSFSRNPSYYDVKRNPALELDKWKRELAPDVVKRIEAVLMASPLHDYFR